MKKIYKIKKSIIILLLLLLLLCILTGCQNKKEEINVNNNTNTNNAEIVNESNIENNDNTKNNINDNITTNKEETISQSENNTEVTYTEYSGVIDAKFSYPSTWVSVGKDEQPMFMSVDGTTSSVNLSAAEFPEAMSFEGFITISKVGIQEKMKIDGDINQEKLELNGREAYRLDYVAEQSENLKLHVSQVVFIESGKVYILTLAADTAKYEKSKDIFEKIISSFTK